MTTQRGQTGVHRARVDRLGRRLHALDVAVYDDIAGRGLSGLGPALTGLSRAANHGRLWMVVAAIAAVRGGPAGTRAARRGLTALAIASATANLAGKRATRRTRPRADVVPMPRRLDPMPASTSFPSGHTASAFAFTIAAGSGAGRWRWPLLGLAATVGVSRVTSGAHYPSDVLGGAAVGIGAAALARRMVPDAPNTTGGRGGTAGGRDDADGAVNADDADPACDTSAPQPTGATAPQVDGPPPCGPDGAGVTILVNPSAGPDGAEQLLAALARELPAARTVVHDPDADLEEELDAAARGAAVLGIAGGDGSVNAAIAAARRHDRPLAILPGGTLNHLASDLGVAEFAQAIAAVRQGRVVAIDLTEIAGRPVGNTAAIGWYPSMVDRRERLESVLGKWPAAAVAATITAFRDRPVDLLVAGTPRRVWLLAIGNGRFVDDHLAPTGRDRLDSGCLDVRLVSAERRGARLRLLAAALRGRPRATPAVEHEVRAELPLAMPERRGANAPTRIARDGEVEDAPDELDVQLHRGGLHVLQPTEP
ncbi:MAG: phosphatase PAP2 family protein [Nitriliruptoraceae bacterium]|nr:phosphatase PAP2 family protein [Nitriliruptoraceae bacterium]